jgi:ABC-type antimicrobial peptide transport system permease subunit
MQRRSDPMVYYPVTQRYVPRLTMLAGTSAATPDLLGRLTRGLRALPGGRGEPAAVTLQHHLAQTSLGPDRIGTLLVAAAAFAALSLALVGVYGVLSDSVLQRRREIALRLALGAPSWKIIGGVFQGGLGLAAAGAAAGLVMSAVAVLVLRHANPWLTMPAAWMWLSCPAVLLAMVAVASVLPARWALSVDPLTITREH